MTDSLLPRILAFVQSLNSEVEPEAIMRRSVVAVAEAVGATQAQLVHVQGERLWSDTVWRKGVWRARKVELPLTAGPAGRVAAGAEAAIVNDAAGYPAVNQDTIRDLHGEHILGLPVRSSGGVTLAVLLLDNERGGRAFDSTDIAVAAAYLPHAAAGIERAKLFVAVRRHEEELKELADHDSLTGLANRRAFLRELPLALEGRSEGEWVALALIDLDGLKDVNETFGLRAGDQALVCAARTLQRLTPPVLAARLGGDEFALIARGTDAATFSAFERRLQRAANGLGGVAAADGRLIQLRGSLGIARSAGETAVELVARAEAALYEAKHSAALAAPARTGVYRPRGRRAIAEELAAILTAAESLSAARDRETLLQRLIAEAARVSDADFGAIGLISEDGSIHFGHAWKEGIFTMTAESLPAAQGTIGEVIAKLGVYRGTNPRGHSQLTRELVERYHLRTLMLVPVLSADTLPLGVLLLANKRGGRPFTEHDANLSRAFALLAGTVADNIRLYAAAEEQSGRLTRRAATTGP